MGGAGKKEEGRVRPGSGFALTRLLPALSPESYGLPGDPSNSPPPLSFPRAEGRRGRWPEGAWPDGPSHSQSQRGPRLGAAERKKGVTGQHRRPAGPNPTREEKQTPQLGTEALRSASLACSARRVECAREASGAHQAGPEAPMEPLDSQVPGLEQPQVPAEERGPGSPASSPSPARAVKEAAGADQDVSGGTKLPPPRPALLRVPPPSLGYGAFRRQTSAGPEPPSPGPAAAEQPRDGETPGAELGPGAAPGEPTPGTWAPMELQVDVRVKPVGAAGGSREPSPAPPTRFLTVPVPESPGFSRHASPAYPLLPRAPSPGGTWGRASPAEGRAESPGSPTCRCRELGLEKREDAVLLPRAEVDGDKKLPRALTLIGLPMYMKSLRWALAVMAVLLAVSAVAIVALASRAGARCRPCPQGWMWSEEHCYYLSAEAQAWEASQAFCSAHHATLPLLSHTEDFLGRYPITTYSWVGARRGPQGWHWIDGAPLPPQLLPEKDKDKPDLKCGGLEGGKLVALDCASPRPWVCAKGTK
ncbi:killer cell lectin-like receptor subfamily G member 2 [Diceros bicornis minor]|uniref:killer cell lectin-like receptor subfamily G member 2 n=1 Tax=Diceros bicornis minor TaxID=77932 RepID=UPI0026EE8A46|nr:killer cell lectin-like receptor subfamily G member 2 [Diceros bicornis minor]